MPPQTLSPLVPDIMGDVPDKFQDYSTLRRDNPISALSRRLAILRKAKRNVYWKGIIIGEEHDHAVQLEAVKVLLRVHGLLRDDGISALQGVNLAFNISVDPNKLQQLIERLDRLTASLPLLPADGTLAK